MPQEYPPNGALNIRVYPTEERNLRFGLDVRAWLQEGIVDWTMPMYYLHFTLDQDMPIDWLLDAAGMAEVSVHARLQPWVRDESTGAHSRVYADTATLRAAVANYLARGADGVYAHSLPWPLGSAEKAILTEIGDPDLMRYGDKRYILRRRQEASTKLGYDAQDKSHAVSLGR